jgi:type VI protein secretion system component VasK
VSFWEFFWLIVVSFLFVAYLMVLFSIITDLFRDRDLNGWAKAAWVIALIFLPILASLIYLIVRGREMAERSMAEELRRQEAQAQYIRTVAAGSSAGVAGGSAVAQIEQAKSLLDAGAITPAEFAALKDRALRDETVPA